MRYLPNLITGLQRFNRQGRKSRTDCAKSRRSTMLNVEELESRVLLSVATTNMLATSGSGPSLAVILSQTPASIGETSGSGQSAQVDNYFLNDLVATVDNMFGSPVAGVSVTFTAPGSGASVLFPTGGSTATAITDSNGHAVEEVLANGVPGSYNVMATVSGVATPASFSLTNNVVPPSPNLLSPTEVQAVYGLNSVGPFVAHGQSFAANGQGQTVAILDVGGDLNVVADVKTFSSQYGLPQMDGLNGDPTFTQVNETGGSQLPKAQSGQVFELDLDVEWVHAIAPGANIVLVEINSLNNSDVESGLNTAHQSGASVLSDSILLAHDLEQTPPAGMTYVSAAGDAYGNKFGSVGGTTTFTSGVGSMDLIVGGTELTQNGTGLAQNNDAYPGENVWQQTGSTWSVTDANGVSHTYPAGTSYGTYQNVLSGSGTKISVSLPSWQVAAAADVGLQTGTTPTTRMAPDVSMVASNLPVADATDFGAANPWADGWGTSFATPMWAGLVAIANEGRQLAGLDPLNSADSPILPLLYSLPSSDFNHVLSNPNAAYDQATGLGTPKANVLIPSLVLAGNGQLTINGSGPSLQQISMNVVNATTGTGQALCVQVQENNQTELFLASAVKSIVVNTNANVDFVNINATPAGVPLTVNLGWGSDTVNIDGLGGPGGSGLGGAATIYGGTGLDTLNVSDPTLGSAVTTTYYVTDWSIQRSNSNAVIFGGLSQATLTGVSPATTGGLVYYHVGSTLTGLPPGLDHQPALNQVGAATLNVDGSGSAGRNIFDIGGSHNYFATTQTLNVNTGTGGENYVQVDTLPSGVTLNIGSAGATDDFVYIGSQSYSLAGIQGPINISNDSGQTKLTVDGSDDASANYTLTNNTLSVSNGPTITYEAPATPTSGNSPIGVTSIVVIEGGAQNIFDAQSAAALTNVLLENLQNDNPLITGPAAGSVQVG